MTDTTTGTRLRVQQWDSEFFMEYVRENRFRPYFGTNEGAMIQLQEDLMKKKGDRITFNLVNKLAGAGVTGSTTLEGSEEALTQRAHLLTVNKLRNGVRMSEIEEQKNAIDLRDAARSTLKVWMSEKLKTSIIAALGSVQTVYGTQVSYAAATAAERNAWLVDNTDRTLFGAATANSVSGVYATALALVDLTDDLLEPEHISLMKRMAQKASPKIRPITIDGDEEWYVMFCGPLNIKSLQANSVWTQANRDARERGKSNPIFTGADFIWDGVIIRQIPEIDFIANVGAGGTVEVEPAYLCGAQAVGIGWAKRTTSHTEIFDYADKYGVAIEEIRGVEKLTFETGSDGSGDFKQHGVVTGWFAVTED